MANYQEKSFKLLKELGNGSYGSVWLIANADRKITVMKKILLTNLSQSEKERCEQEVNILSSVSHPNIVSYKGSYKDREYLCIFMGFCEKGDLYRLIKNQKGCLFPEQQIIRWFIQIVMALLYLHQRNILHRDLKTQNIFLTKWGLVKVGDFGIAKHLNSSKDMAKTLVGTPFYMSPEILSGTPYNQKSDIWALGCCLFELLTLKHAFQSKDLCSLLFKITKGEIGDIPSSYSKQLCSLVHSMLYQLPEERPTASEILRMSFIRKHMQAFLVYTKDIENNEKISKSGTPDFASEHLQKQGNRNFNVNPDKINLSPCIQAPLSRCYNNVTQPEICADQQDKCFEITLLDRFQDEVELEEEQTHSFSSDFHESKGARFSLNSESRKRRRKRISFEGEWNESSSFTLEEDKPLEMEEQPYYLLNKTEEDSFGQSKSISDKEYNLPILDDSKDICGNKHMSNENENEVFHSYEDNDTFCSIRSNTTNGSSYLSSENLSGDSKSFSYFLDNTLKTEGFLLDSEPYSLQTSFQQRKQTLLKELDVMVGMNLSRKIETILCEGSWVNQRDCIKQILGDDDFSLQSPLIWEIKLCQEMIN